MSLSKLRKNYSRKVWKAELVKPKSKNSIYLSDYFIDSEINQYKFSNKLRFDFDFKIPRQYSFPDSSNLNSRISDFHIKRGLKKGSFKIFESEGSTPMIATMVLLARELGFKKIYSISPLYFSVHRICSSLDIEIIPCNNDLTHEEKYILKLPKKKSILFLTDPIWAIGRHHSNKLFIDLKRWQEKTNSLIFVDSSFDYTDWIKRDLELTQKLDPQKTFRLICPTKVLGLHGLRFSYLICPSKYAKRLNSLSFSSIGPTSYFYSSIRKKIFNEIDLFKKSPMAKLAEKRFSKIRSVLIKKEISFINPTCGVYLFAKIRHLLEKKDSLNKYSCIAPIGVDIPFKKYSGYTKINLLMRKLKFNKFLEDLEKI